MSALSRRQTIVAILTSVLAGCSQHGGAPRPAIAAATLSPRAVRLRELVPEVEIADGDLVTFLRDFDAAQHSPAFKVARAARVLSSQREQFASEGAPLPVDEALCIDVFLLSTDYFKVLRGGGKRVKYVELFVPGDSCSSPYA